MLLRGKGQVCEHALRVFRVFVAQRFLFRVDGHRTLVTTNGTPPLSRVEIYYRPAYMCSSGQRVTFPVFITFAARTNSPNLH
jgi:hypothetical protein